MTVSPTARPAGGSVLVAVDGVGPERDDPERAECALRDEPVAPRQQVVEEQLDDPFVLAEPGGSACCYWNRCGAQCSHPARTARPLSRVDRHLCCWKWLRSAVQPPGAKDF